MCNYFYKSWFPSLEYRGNGTQKTSQNDAEWKKYKMLTFPGGSMMLIDCGYRRILDFRRLFSESDKNLFNGESLNFQSLQFFSCSKILFDVPIGQ